MIIAQGIYRGVTHPGLFWFLVFVDDDVDDDDDDDILASDLLGHASTNKDDNTTCMSLWSHDGKNKDWTTNTSLCLRHQDFFLILPRYQALVNYRYTTNARR